MNLPQVELSNYLIVLRIEDQRNAEERVAESQERQNDVGREISEGAKAFLFPLQYLGLF